VPILDAGENLLGVIACDSKRSYAFAKVTEKIIVDCASQAATMIQLHRKLGGITKAANPSRTGMLDALLEKLRTYEGEDTLLCAAADLPPDIIERDALVVLTVSEGGVGTGRYYTVSKPNRVEHRLLEIVCQHKKIICGDRSVHALPTRDDDERSFLSVPFRVLGKEAGSFNVLSRPYDAFDASEISALEQIAAVVGRELERIRLRDILASSKETMGISSWKHFLIQAKLELGKAAAAKKPLTLIRISLDNIADIEDIAGVSAATSVLQTLMRLVDQVRRSRSLACYLYGFQILLLLDSHDAEETLGRLKRMIERLAVSDLSNNAFLQNTELRRLLTKGLSFTSASFPKEGTTVEDLTARTLRHFEWSTEKDSSTEKKLHARTWS